MHLIQPTDLKLKLAMWFTTFHLISLFALFSAFSFWNHSALPYLASTGLVSVGLLISPLRTSITKTHSVIAIICCTSLSGILTGLAIFLNVTHPREAFGSPLFLWRLFVLCGIGLSYLELALICMLHVHLQPVGYIPLPDSDEEDQLSQALEESRKMQQFNNTKPTNQNFQHVLLPQTLQKAQTNDKIQYLIAIQPPVPHLVYQQPQQLQV